MVLHVYHKHNVAISKVYHLNDLIDLLIIDLLYISKKITLKVFGKDCKRNHVLTSFSLKQVTKSSNDIFVFPLKPILPMERTYQLLKAVLSQVSTAL